MTIKANLIVEEELKLSYNFKAWYCPGLIYAHRVKLEDISTMRKQAPAKVLFQAAIQIPSSRRDEPQPANSLAGTQIAQCKFPRPDGTPEIMAVFNRRIKILNLSSHSLPDESMGYYQRSFQDQVYKSVDVNVR